MATVRTVTVKASGRDYTTLNGAFSGEVGNMVSLDRQLDIVCNAIADTTMANTSNSWTTDATRFVRVKAAAGAENKGTTSSGYRLVVSGDRAFLNYLVFLKIEDIYIEATSSGSLAIQSLVNLNGVAIIDRCYLVQSGGSYNGVTNITTLASGSAVCLIRNSILKTANDCLYVSDNSTVTTYIYNCTFIGRLV